MVAWTVSVPIVPKPMNKYLLHSFQHNSINDTSSTQMAANDFAKLVCYIESLIHNKVVAETVIC